jgi:hypothetical protein
VSWRAAFGFSIRLMSILKSIFLREYEADRLASQTLEPDTSTFVVSISGGGQLCFV